MFCQDFSSIQASLDTVWVRLFADAPLIYCKVLAQLLCFYMWPLPEERYLIFGSGTWTSSHEKGKNTISSRSSTILFLESQGRIRRWNIGTEAGECVDAGEGWESGKGEKAEYGEKANNKYAIYAYTHGPVTGSGFLLVSVSVHEQSVN